MSITTAARSVLIAFDELDRQLGHGRSVMVQHREAYAALRAAVDVLRVAMEARTLDGESAPEYVTREPSEPLDLSNPPNDWTAIDDRTDGIIDIQTGVLLRQMPDWYAVWHSDGKWYCGKNTNPPRFLPGFDSAYQAMKHASQTWRIS